MTLSNMYIYLLQDFPVIYTYLREDMNFTSLPPYNLSAIDIRVLELLGVFDVVEEALHDAMSVSNLFYF